MIKKHNDHTALILDRELNDFDRLYELIYTRMPHPETDLPILLKNEMRLETKKEKKYWQHYFSYILR